MIPEIKKRCSVCGMIKPVSCFSKEKRDVESQRRERGKKNR